MFVGNKKMAKEDVFKIFYAISFAWQLGFMIALPIGGFIILGLFLDGYFGTRPWLLFMFLFIGLVVTFYEIYHSVAPLLENKKEKEND